LISVPEITVNVVAGTAPKLTFDAPANPEPVIVTSVPPVVGPEPGVTLATTGAGEVAKPVPVNVIWKAWPFQVPLVLPVTGPTAVGVKA
jgi:hypothetical protein